MDGPSCALFVDLAPADRGVLSALSFGVFADNVGVLSPSSKVSSVLSSGNTREGRSAAAAGNAMSSMNSDGPVSMPFEETISACLPGILIKVAGVAGALEFCD